MDYIKKISHIPEARISNDVFFFYTGVGFVSVFVIAVRENVLTFNVNTQMLFVAKPKPSQLHHRADRCYEAFVPICCLNICKLVSSVQSTLFHKFV